MSSGVRLTKKLQENLQFVWNNPDGASYLLTDQQRDAFIQALVETAKAHGIEYQEVENVMMVWR